MLLKITPSNLLNISCRYQSNLIVYLCYEYFNQGCQLEGCHTLTNAIDLGILTRFFLFFPMQIDCSTLLYLKAEFIFPSVPVYLGKPSRCLIFTKTSCGGSEALTVYKPHQTEQPKVKQTGAMDRRERS